jgi:hypothetical protein
MLGTSPHSFHPSAGHSLYTVHDCPQESGQQDSKPMLSNRILHEDASVCHLHNPRWQPLATCGC